MINFTDDVPSVEGFGAMIKEYGFASMSVGAGPDTPPYVYSIGHNLSNNPDIIICGLQFADTGA